jgi:hypothetical protein
VYRFQEDYGARSGGGADVPWPDTDDRAPAPGLAAVDTVLELKPCAGMRAAGTGRAAAAAAAATDAARRAIVVDQEPVDGVKLVVLTAGARGTVCLRDLRRCCNEGRSKKN